MTYGGTMATTTRTSAAGSSTFGAALKEWRGVRRMSQLELGSVA